MEKDEAMDENRMVKIAERKINPDWILIEDEMPPVGKPVIIATDKDGVYTSVLTKDKKWYMPGVGIGVMFMTGKIVKWMHLPKA